MNVHIEPVVTNKRGSADTPLLCVRMKQLGLDRDAMSRSDATLFNMLQRRCAKCEFPDACAGDLRDDPTNPVWEAYCPNSALLTRLSGA